MREPTLVKKHKCAGGWVQYYEHDSTSCGVPMRFSVFLPPAAFKRPVPVLYWLSGLTCTEENFMAKAGAQTYAADHGLMLVAPDTSPRGLNLPGEDDGYDFGSGAGFYVNATQAPWSTNYRMYDYVVDELPALIKTHFQVIPDRESIFGHSMGGHGALVIALRNPGRYRSVSAFAPICAPMRCPWGEKAFTGYLGDDRAAWAEYDACELLTKSKHSLPLLVEQGSDDNFLAEQLHPQYLEEVCHRQGHTLDLRRRVGYDHSYYFIHTFIGEHIAYHAHALQAD